MTSSRQVIVVVLLIMLAAVLQGRAAHAIALHHAEPDFVLLVLACGATLVGGTRGPLLGLWAGLLTAALIPGTLGSFLASRTLAGAFAGWLHGAVIRDSLLVPPLIAFSTTAVAEFSYVLMAPTHHLHTWFFARSGECLYNTVLALPVYFLMRRLHIGREQEDPFALRY